ncbi:MAG: flagellar biosynthetic protein FliO [Thiogranum sp.]
MMFCRAQQVTLFASGCATFTLGYAAESDSNTAGALKGAAGLGHAQDPMAMTSLWQLTLGMLLVLGLIVAIAWVLKRSGRFQMAAGGGLRILGGLSMGTRERVVLLQVGETQLLVGVAPGRVQTLHVLDKPLESMHATASAAPGFADQLSRFLNKEKTR